jgi:DNA repair protein RadA/Sms
MQVAKGLNITTLLIGHVTKDGQLSGPKLLEHMVDAVLYFEGERYKDLRLLRSVKNRFGSTQEMGVFEMQETGLKDVLNPSDVFLSDAALHPVPGCVTVCSLEGSRPLLIELQALAGQSVYASPRRVVNGVETNRLHQVIAVLERRVGLSFANLDLYINVVGGMKIDEPAVDLGMAIALVTSLRDISVKSGTVLMGEIGLTGEIRSVRRWRERLMEAVKIGFTRIVLPLPQGRSPSVDVEALQRELPIGVELHFVRNIREAITICLDA